MLKRFLPLLTLFTWHCSHAQNFAIKELRATGLDTSNLYNQYEFTYPYIILSNKAVQDSINLALQEAYLNTDSISGLDSNSVKLCLNHTASDGFTFISYEVVFTSPRLLGLDVFAEAIGAYPVGWTSHYLFDLTTGHQYLLGELLNNTNKDQFAAKVIAAMKDSMNNYTIEIIKEVAAGQRDSSELDDVKYFLDECMDGTDSNSVLNTVGFYFQNDILYINHLCIFPHIVKALEPTFELSYPALQLKEFLLPKIYQELISQKANK